MQEAYRPPRSKCSLCCCLLGGGGWEVPHLWREGIPSSPGWGGVPHPRSTWKVPHPRWGVPHPVLDGGGTLRYPPVHTWEGYPPISWMGYPRQLDRVPPTWTWDGVPPVSWMGKCRQTHRLVSKHNLPSYFVHGR